LKKNKKLNILQKNEVFSSFFHNFLVKNKKNLIKLIFIETKKYKNVEKIKNFLNKTFIFLI